MAANTQQMTPQQQNAMAKAYLLSTGTDMIVPLAPVSGITLNSGQTTITLDRAGIFRKLRMQVEVVIANSTAAAIDLVPSPVAPYNVFNTISYKDFSGALRTNSHPAIIEMVNNMKRGRPSNRIPSSLSSSGISPLLFNVPTSIPATGTATLTYEQEIPLEYGNGNMEGAVLAQTSNNQHSLVLNSAPGLVGTDPWLYPYVGALPAGITVSSINVTVYQEYIQPANINVLPLLDLMKVYAIEGNATDGNNLVANTYKYIDYPISRQILSFVFAYDNGAAALNPGSDITEFGIVNGGTLYPAQMNAMYFLQRQRDNLGADSPDGMYYFGSRRKPVDTTMYANMQARFKPSSANAGSYIAYGFEMVYDYGAALPGIITA